MITPQEITIKPSEKESELVRELKQYSRLLASDINNIEKRLTAIEKRLTDGSL